ncbi:MULTISPECIES: Rieske 2Fe-2S domain-containing protein [unclassified Variovorax]|uniref:Rieske (2Fe-2S) protein n=1 Tax=unclassified Variovorax TaxID=663243 RepID=UPI00163DD8DC|nr:Rieske 2Fe-2S domain-containing protein [Variovorax sp. KBS0712]
MPEASLPVRLCALAELRDGHARGFDPAGSGQDSVFAVQSGGQVRVWADRCPHLGTPLPWRRHAYLNAAGEHIVCAAHGALFDLDSGLCVHGPCRGVHLEAVPFRIGRHGDLMLIDPAQLPQPT